MRGVDLIIPARRVRLYDNASPLLPVPKVCISSKDPLGPRTSAVFPHSISLFDCLRGRAGGK